MHDQYIPLRTDASKEAKADQAKKGMKFYIRITDIRKKGN